MQFHKYIAKLFTLAFARETDILSKSTWIKFRWISSTFFPPFPSIYIYIYTSIHIYCIYLCIYIMCIYFSQLSQKLLVFSPCVLFFKGTNYWINCMPSWKHVLGSIFCLIKNACMKHYFFMACIHHWYNTLRKKTNTMNPHTFSPLEVETGCIWKVPSLKLT